MTKRILAPHALVAALHMPPSLSYPAFPGRERALDLVLRDVEASIAGGANGILLENELDKPHTLLVSKAQVAWLTEASSAVRRACDVAVGINVQRIDWEATFAIAVAAGLDFVRLDVFVDRVRMQGEEVAVRPEEVVAYRRALGGDAIAIFADVHVKHAELLSTLSLAESARAARDGGAAGIIVTGQRTGQPPSVADLDTARDAVGGGARIAIGSGLDASNARGLAAHADLAIVGTSLKEGDRVAAERVRAVANAWIGA